MVVESLNYAKGEAISGKVFSTIELFKVLLKWGCWDRKVVCITTSNNSKNDGEEHIVDLDLKMVLQELAQRLSENGGFASL